MRNLVVKQKTENQRNEISILIFFNAKIGLRKTEWISDHVKLQWLIKISSPPQKTSSRQFYGLIILSNFTRKDNLSSLCVVPEIRKSGKGAHLS